MLFNKRGMNINLNQISSQMSIKYQSTVVFCKVHELFFTFLFIRFVLVFFVLSATVGVTQELKLHYKQGTVDKSKRLLKPANNNKSAFLLYVGRIWEVLSDCLTFHCRKGQPLFFKPVAKYENSLLLKYACSCFRPVLLWKSGIYVPHGASW